MSERVRSFIAVRVPPESAERLREAQERLRASDAGVKWVSPDSFHITLKFLGGVERERLGPIWQSVSEVLEGSPPFLMRFRGVGAFPSRERARVIWAGLTEGAAELKELAERVEEACLGHGFPREGRPFRAHLTLGRVRRPGPNPSLAGAMVELEGGELGEAGIDRVLLMESRLTPQGAVYHALEEKLLGKEGAQ